MCGRPTHESPESVSIHVLLVILRGLWRCIYRFRMYVAIDVPLRSHYYTFSSCLVVAHIFYGYILKYKNRCSVAFVHFVVSY